MDPMTMDPLTMEANAKQARRDAARLRLQMEAIRATSEPEGGNEASGPSAPSRLLRALASFSVFRGRPSADRPHEADASAKG